MAVHTFAAIYIGSYEVSLKIFEMPEKKKMRGIDYVRRRIELGRDAYSKNSIGYELVESLCDTLLEFTKIMKEYQVDACEAYASAVLRDISNELFILEQIRLRTGLNVHVLSNSEHRFVSYQSVAVREEFEEMIKKSAAVVDIGGAGLQITVFSDGDVVTTQHLGLGAMRMREQLESKSSNLAQYELQIGEMAAKELQTFRKIYLNESSVEYLIVMGDYTSELVQRMEKNHDNKTVDIQKFIRYLEKLARKSLAQISEDIGLSNESDALIVPYMIICQCVAQMLGAKSLWAPGVIMADGIACDYAGRHKQSRQAHDFEADILSAARSLSRRYMSDSPHVDTLSEISVLIFDTMKKEHGLGRRQRLLLKVATILHDCGKYISVANAAQCAYDIILSSEIIGMSHREREIVASTVLYNRLALPEYREVADRLDQESYLTVAKLSAILRVSNAIDQSHKQKFKKVKAQVRGRDLLITLETEEDIALEKALFDAKTAYFEHVFSIRPLIREKRIYNN
ncbi:MAG: phosphatase [Roseburia sp.]|jgi:exopolyphosphatase/guanosine-5'-triphosphate,3'-diphosphate pyrophosphatase|nr:phosphatase [Roseburia sp.]